MRFLRRLPGRKARSAAEEDDADVEREIARRLWSNHRLLPPTNRFHDRIRLVMYLLMLYVCFYVPMQVAFEIDYPVWQLAIDYVIDLLFIVDMFFSEYVSDADALSGVLLREHTLTMDALKLTKNKKVDTEQKLAPIADTGSAVPATLKQVSLSAMYSYDLGDLFV